MSNHDSSRRKFIKAAAYTAPVIMTLSVAPSIATAGSNLSQCDDDTLRCQISNNSDALEGAFNQAQSSGGGFSAFIKSLLSIFGL